MLHSSGSKTHTEIQQEQKDQQVHLHWLIPWQDQPQELPSAKTKSEKKSLQLQLNKHIINFCTSAYLQLEIS